MSRNPFEPPRATVAAPTRGGQARKPASVWLLQALAVLVGGGFMWVTVAFAVYPGRISAIGWAGVLEQELFNFFMVPFAALVLFGSQCRRTWGRWFGLAFLATLFAAGGFVCYTTWVTAPVAPGPVRLFDGDAQVLLAVALLMGLVLFLTGRYGFSAKARAWFDSDRSA